MVAALYSLAPTTTCSYAPDGTSMSAGCSRLPRCDLESSSPAGAESTCTRSVALCLAGSPRTLFQRHVLSSIRTQLIRGLNTSVVDVFAVLDTKDIVGGHFLAHEPVDAPRAALQKALGCLAPRAVAWWQPHPAGVRTGQKVAYDANASECPPAPPPPAARRPRRSRSPRNSPRGGDAAAAGGGTPYQGPVLPAAHAAASPAPPRAPLAQDWPPGWEPPIYDAALAQIASWAQCTKLVEQVERERGSAYDVFVRARPDSFWLAPHPRACDLDPTAAYVRRNGVSDQNFVLPRAAATTMFASMLAQAARCPNATLRADGVGGGGHNAARNAEHEVIPSSASAGAPAGVVTTPAAPPPPAPALPNLEQWVMAAARAHAGGRVHHLVFPSVVVRGRNAPPELTTNHTMVRNTNATTAVARASPPRGAGTLCFYSTRGTGVSVAECMKRLYPVSATL